MGALWMRLLVTALCLVGIAEERAVAQLEPRSGEIDIDWQREAGAKGIVFVDFVDIGQASVLVMDIPFVSQIIHHEDNDNWQQFDVPNRGGLIVWTAFEGFQVFIEDINSISAKRQIAHAGYATSWRDRISPKWLSAAQFFGDCLKAINGVVILVFDEIIAQLVPQGHMERAGPSKILDSVLDREMQSATIPPHISNGRVNVYPGTVFCSHLIQLAFHRSSLISQNCDCLLCLSGRAAHLGQLIVHDPRLTKIYPRLDAGDYEERKSEERLSPMGKPHIEKRFSGAPLAAGWFLSFMALGIWIAWHAHERESVRLGIVAFLAFSAAIPGSFILLLRLNGLL